jgi:hypothetical protein
MAFSSLPLSNLKVKTVTVASSGTARTLIGIAENTVATGEQVTIRLILIPIFA